jgi:lysophospholipase L1-like esterase
VVFQTNAGSDALAPIAVKADFPEGSWLQRHDTFVARAKQGDVDLLWLGDSIIDNWNRAKGTYRKLYPNVKAANFGIGGDGTQNLLWRLENGELDGLQPKVVIVLIGGNNVQWHQTEQIAAAIERIVKTIRAKCPKAKVLLMGILPRADIEASSPGHQRIREVNAIISKLDDGQYVRYLDIRSKLTNADGTLLEDAFVDKVHLSSKGFTLWAESMQPLLDGMTR